jgi:hypothetical protein
VVVDFDGMGPTWTVLVPPPTISLSFSRTHTLSLAVPLSLSLSLSPSLSPFLSTISLAFSLSVVVDFDGMGSTQTVLVLSHPTQWATYRFLVDELP